MARSESLTLLLARLRMRRHLETVHRSLSSIEDLTELMLPRTQRQKEILDYIVRFLERRGHEPSYAQIANHFGVKSRATIAKHIAALERRGLLQRRDEEGAFALNVRV